MSDARTRVLSAVSQALGDLQARARMEPKVTVIEETHEDRHELARRFVAELAAIQGSATTVRDRSECAAFLASYLEKRGVRSVAVQSSALATDVASQLQGFDVSLASRHDKHELARIDCGLLEARSLLADTGSAVLLLDNAADRVLPYLPRTCAIVADLASLHATLSPQALACIRDAAEGGTRGEALIVAGPSRSADIEKMLVLGAHGPQAVVVFIIENA